MLRRVGDRFLRDPVQQGPHVGIRFLRHTVVGITDRMTQEPDPDMRALLYRIAQEAIANAAKHAQASRVQIEAVSAGDGVTLRVRDDGRGFVPDLDAAPAPGHLGLSTIVERAELAGGWARIHSSPGEGTTVECWLPLDVATGDPALGA